MDHAESRAKLIVEAVLRGSEMRFRVDQSCSVHDFDLHLSDGTIEAVEVTASVDREAEETNAAIVDTKNGGLWIPTVLCKNDWHIHLSSHARISVIRKEADRCLADVEAAGLSDFFGPGDWAEDSCIRRAYEDLRIFSGSVISGRSLGRISMAPPGGGGAVGGILVHEAVMEEALKQDNRKKLAASGFLKRHLAVYIHPRNFLPWVGLIDMEPPPRGVSLPAEITDVWAFAENRDLSGFSVWKAQAGKSWGKIGPFTIAAPSTIDRQPVTAGAVKRSRA